MFGVEVAKLKLTPTQNTQVDAAGQVGKLQNLLVQMADDKAALASDAEVLREQLLSYQVGDGAHASPLFCASPLSYVSY
eukprot:scaffold289113_cov36-Tisochrysis_lutea.AAC.2